MPVCAVCSDPSPALVGRERAAVATLVLANPSRAVGVREMRSLLASHPPRGRVVVVLARHGFTAGARALASAAPRVVLCVP